jgi:hypothetical protein
MATKTTEQQTPSRSKSSIMQSIANFFTTREERLRPKPDQHPVQIIYHSTKDTQSEELAYKVLESMLKSKFGKEYYVMVRRFRSVRAK